MVTREQLIAGSGGLAMGWLGLLNLPDWLKHFALGLSALFYSSNLLALYVELFCFQQKLAWMLRGDSS